VCVYQDVVCSFMFGYSESRSYYVAQAGLELEILWLSL
jgi:hypothetical protein